MNRTHRVTHRVTNRATHRASSGQLKISQLVALAAVAEHGSFSAAALHLGLAQSTVSHAIASLEEDLGIVLLLRHRTGAVLTPIGSQICHQAQTVLTQLEGIRHTANQAKELQTGRVRPAAPRTVATHSLTDVISRFRRSHPGMTVEIIEYDRYAEVEQALRDGKYDVREDSTLMGMVAKGLGVAVLARLEAEPVPPGVRVQSLPKPLERVVGVAILENAVLPRAVFAFLDVLLALPVGPRSRSEQQR